METHNIINISSINIKKCFNNINNEMADILEIIRNNGRYELQMFEGGYYFEANGFMTESYFNPVDTCYEFILKLHELNML